MMTIMPYFWVVMGLVFFFLNGLRQRDKVMRAEEYKDQAAETIAKQDAAIRLQGEVLEKQGKLIQDQQETLRQLTAGGMHP